MKIVGYKRKRKSEFFYLKLSFSSHSFKVIFVEKIEPIPNFMHTSLFE